MLPNFCSRIRAWTEWSCCHADLSNAAQLKVRDRRKHLPSEQGPCLPWHLSCNRNSPLSSGLPGYENELHWPSATATSWSSLIPECSFCLRKTCRECIHRRHIGAAI